MRTNAEGKTTGVTFATLREDTPGARAYFDVIV